MLSTIINLTDHLLPDHVILKSLSQYKWYQSVNTNAVKDRQFADEILIKHLIILVLANQNSAFYIQRALIFGQLT